MPQPRNLTLFQKPEREIKTVFIHCSASDRPEHDNIETIKKWHISRGWNTVGYHYFISKTGDLELGRDLERIPAAQKGFNTNSIAICVSGLREENFTEESFKMLKRLCYDINRTYNGEVTFHGHCEVNPNKTCPVFDYKYVLNLDDQGYMP